MKLLLALGALFVVLGGAVTYWSYPDQVDGPARLYWVTDMSPSRRAHAAGFEQWQLEQGHVRQDGRPLASIAIDPNNGDQDKIVIQGVAGVGGNIIDTHWGRQMRLFREVGIIRDMTDAARAGGFSPAQTWSAMEPEITFNGRQYMYPCNVAVRLLWVNEALFERLGMPLPPTRWSFEEFERIGQAFLERANAPGGRRTHFFCDDVPIELMYRSVGLSIFNETLTACDLDDPRYVEVMRSKHRWMYELHLLPSPEDISAMQVEGGWGGSGPRLFNEGRLGLLYSGRYMLMQFRQFARDGGEPLELEVVEPPHGGFPNTRTTTRASAIYRGGEQQELVELFLRYLASERYNRMIIDDADALPPNPAFVDSEAFRRPADWPNEWGCHERFVEAMKSTAIGGSYSEFILSTEAERIRDRFIEEFDAGLISAEDAARRTAELIGLRIARNLDENPAKRPQYEALVARQLQIDALLSAGQQVPAAWIENPFYRRYYASLGLLTESTPAGEAR